MLSACVICPQYGRTQRDLACAEPLLAAPTEGNTTRSPEIVRMIDGIIMPLGPTTAAYKAMILVCAMSA